MTASAEGPLPIAIDAMGGDKGPGVVVDGVLDSLEDREGRFVIVGRADEIRPVMASRGAANHPLISVVDAPDVISMHDSPVEAVREKESSSLVVAAELVREGSAAALLSPGNTGAVLAAATLLTGRIRGVERPGIATVIPTRSGYSILIDVGANVDSRPTHLLQFGIMGAIYAQTILGIEEPRIGLLSIGEERSKGNELTRQTSPLFEETFTAGRANSLGKYLGNVEGRDIVNGNADVIVCDGFVGNVILKFGEGLAYTILDLLKERLLSTPVRKAATMVLKGAFTEFKKRIDYTEYGGAPLLGVRRPCIICHGSSDAKAIRSAVRVTHAAIEKDVCGRIAATVRGLRPERDAS